MQGSAKKNLIMFNKLCGENALHKVVLVTTMWENLKTQDEGQAREAELRNTDAFWGWMSARGSKIERHTNDADSGKRLIGMFVPSKEHAAPEKVILTIQEEMADQNMSLEDTKAGEAVRNNIEKESLRIHQELEEYQRSARKAILERDTRRHQDIEEIMADMRQQETLLVRNQEALSADMQQMVRARYDQAIAEIEEEQSRRLSNQYSLRSDSNTDISTPQSAASKSPTWSMTPSSLPLLRRHSTFKFSQRLSLSLRGRHCSFIGPAYTKS